MIRNIILFAAMFVAGALLALVARAAWFNPHADSNGQPNAGGEYSAMVSNRLAPPAQKAVSSTPAQPPAETPAAKPRSDPHVGHGAVTPTSTSSAKPVNTICAICGMEVDPSLPTAEYQGKTIGFGCRMCPPKFKAAPDKYGPSYLRNEVFKG